MAKTTVEKFEKKARGSVGVGIVSLLISVIGFIAARGYSDEAEKERRRDPAYLEELRKREAQKQALREKELEAEKQRYILEQEKLKVEAENKRLSDIQAMNTEALEKLDGWADPEDLDDYGLIDAAYQILDILSKDGVSEQVKYRGMKRISEFRNFCVSRDTHRKLEEILVRAKSL